MKARPRRRIDINLEELDRLIDLGMQAPLSASEGGKLKTAMHSMADKLLGKRNTEKTNAVLETPPTPATESMSSDKKSFRPDMGVTLLRRLQVPTGL